MSAPEAPMDERESREAAAYDEGTVWQQNHAWQMRVRHVLECPNTVHGEDRFVQLTEKALAGNAARAAEVGCGPGDWTSAILDAGAESIFAFDISSGEIDAARSANADDRVTFAVQSADKPFEGTYDLITGRSVLHHIEFKTSLERWYRDNLAPGGTMLFMEPMGHPLILGFHRFVRSAHTDDEWPITPADIADLRGLFASVQVTPINLLSLPVGALSTYIFSAADNGLTRAADRIDRTIGRRSRLASRGRQGIIAIHKPAA